MPASVTQGGHHKVNIANICTRGPQSLSSLRARRDHDPALAVPLSRELGPRFIYHVAWAELYFRTKWRLRPSSRLATLAKVFIGCTKSIT